MAQAQIVNKSTSWMLEKAAGSILVKVAGQVCEKGFDAVLGDPSDPIRQEIREAVDEVQKIKEAADALSGQLNQAVLPSWKEGLDSILNHIIDHWRDVTGDMTMAMNISQNNPSSQGTKAMLRRVQIELKEHLAAASKHIPNHLNAAHDHLGSDWPARETAGRAFKNTNDFLSYYASTKTIFMQVWTKAVSGITLLQMAFAVKDAWPDGKSVIDRAKEQLRLQEDIFRTAVGGNTCRLSEHILNSFDYDWARSVKILADWGEAVHFAAGYDKGDTWVRDVWAPVIGSDNQSRWTLDPGWIDDAKKVRLIPFRDGCGPSGTYTVFFTLKDVRNEDRLSQVNKRLSDGADYAILNSGTRAFFVKPIAPGADRYRISLDHNKWYMNVEYPTNYFRFNEWIDFDSDRYRWRIEPW